MNNTATLTYESFLEWHKEASARLQEGEWMAAPSVEQYAFWQKNRIEWLASQAAHEEVMSRWG